jgi:hypothetical protein
MSNTPLVAALGAALVSLASSARAEGLESESGKVEDARGPLRWHADRVEAEAGAPESQGDIRSIDRPFLYLVDPRLPASLTAVGSYAASFTSTEAAARPLGANANRTGFVNELRLDFGLVDRLSTFGTARFAPPLEAESGVRGAFDAGFRVLVTSPASTALRVGVDGAFLRDFSASNGGVLRATATFDAGPLRLGTLVHSEKVFASGRDDVDLYVVMGASVRAVERLRVGAEYVAQDLEEIGEPAAEGGVRQFASASVAWAADRFSVAAGPALGLGGHSPTLLGRLQASMAF